MDIGLPNLPGGLPPSAATSLLSFGASQLIGMFAEDYWGIFSQWGVPLSLVVDSIVTVQHKNSSKIAQAPVQSGAFASYNKVQDPYTITVQLVKGESVMGRSLLLSTLEFIAGSTELFTIITPEAVYVNCNVTGYDYKRSHNDGRGLIIANVQFQEVRTVSPEYVTTEQRSTDNAQNPEAQTPKGSGTVQAKEVSTLAKWFN